MILAAFIVSGLTVMAAEDEKTDIIIEDAPPVNVQTTVKRSSARGAYTEAVNAPVIATPKKDLATPPPPPRNKSQVANIQNDRRLKISQIIFSGNSIYTQEKLAALVADDIKHPLTFSELQGLARKVEDYYHQNGYQIARVVIAKQDVSDGGPLTFTVLEGRLGSINVSGNKRYSTKRVLNTFAHNVKSGEAFTIADIERPLIHLNDLSGVSADSTLKPGKETGTTDIDVVIIEKRRISGSVEVNNFGGNDYSEWRAIPGIAFPNLTGVGDELSAFGVLSFENTTDNYYYQVEYSRPLNTLGTFAQVYFGQGNNVAGNEFDILDICGENLSWGAGVSHHLVFSPRSSLKFSGWFEWADLEQTMLGYTTSDDRIRKLRFGADYEVKDNYGRNFISLYWHQGLGHSLGAMADNSEYSSRAYSGADNNFSKLTLGFMRLHSFTPQLYALLNFSGQYAIDPLVAGEQFYIGGANSVRGQPSSVFSGDDGFTVNAELRYSVLANKPALLQLTAFFDHGETFLRHPILGQKKQRAISGTGFGLRSQICTGLDARFDTAFPVGVQRGDDVYFYGQLRYSF